MARRPPPRESPRPFLKWAGGKGSLLPEILGRLPTEIPLYIEPFVGGGAVFFALARTGRVRRARLADRNPHLVEVWHRVQDSVEAVITATHTWSPDRETYYAVRALDPATLTSVERAARVIWLNRHCFNGLYRLNRKGQFNVPYGRYAQPQRIDEDNLRRCSEALAVAEIVEGDFDQVLDHIEENAVVYLDPPYDPLSPTSSFSAYDGFVFTEADQARLAARFAGLPGVGVRHAVLSNSSTELTRRLYHRPELIRVTEVPVRRNINRNGKGRAPVMEILAELLPEGG